MTITQEITLGEVVKDNFKTADIFESYGLDFCCNGKRTIEEACLEKNINPAELIEKIKIANINKNGNNNFDNMELDVLIDYIVNTHHSYVAGMLPKIDEHSIKVLNAHSKNHPELINVIETWNVVRAELANHMLKEERMLFPYIKSLVNSKRYSSEYQFAPFGTVENPIAMMEREHSNAGEAFFEIKRLTNDYAIPPDACPTFNVFFNELREFENDLHIHIHLENNILHPKAIQLEKEILKN